MLLRHRRYFALLSFVLLSTPLVFGVLRPDSPELILKEGRILAPAPQPPRSWEALRALPSQVDAYLKDHFGLRQMMIRTHRDLSHPVVYGNESVLIGRNGRMFYLGREMVRQSAGLVLRDQKVADTAALMAAMRDALAERGGRVLVAVPPNSSTLYQDDLPFWAQNRGRKTEYDLFLSDLAARDVKAVDLRPVMKSVETDSPAYLIHDTHWTALAALAGFNAIVEADSHPDWRLDPATSIGRPVARKGGDLARVLGVEDNVSENAAELVLPLAGKAESLSEGPMPDYVLTSDKPGPTIVVIGDSFTASYFPRMLLRHVGRAIWLNHRQCGFDWKWLDKFRPDEVWWVPTERFLVCDEGVRPLNFGGSSADRAPASVTGASKD
jgi:hypothetical protein